MSSTFNPQILVEKLTKLNASQASIETLSHWCIFHMNKAKNVVETWSKQFHSSPREQRMAFLYLANDILQNSRRKGMDFVVEFWKVLPGALRDVIDNGDASRKNEALRLINIWDERKVFGSRGHTLKEEFGGKRPDTSVKNGRQFNPKLRQSAGSSLDKIVSGYEVIYGGQLDEDVVLSRCREAMNCMEKVTKDAGGNMAPGKPDGAGYAGELQQQHAVLRGCIDQLRAVEASRTRLVSHLREALKEQELKLDQVRSQLQSAQSQSDQAANILQQSLNPKTVPLGDDQVPKEAQPPRAAQALASENTKQPSQVLYTRQAPPAAENSGVMDGKSAAAAVAAKLTASTSSAQMLTFVLSSLAQEGVIGTTVKESPADYPPEKKHKPDADQSYVPQPPGQQPPLPSFPHLDSSNNDGGNQQLAQPSSSPPSLPPLPSMPPYPMAQYMQSAGPMSNVPYSYGSAPQQPPPPMPGYHPLGPAVSGVPTYAPPPPNPYQTFQGTEAGFYSQQSAVPMAPISRQ